MNIKTILTFVVGFCPLVAFGADDRASYKQSIERWGESPLALKLSEKLKSQTLAIDDLKDVLKEGIFGTSKANAPGLKKVSEGKTAAKFEHAASFSTQKYILSYQSRTLGPREEIPNDGILTFLGHEKVGKTYKTYKYQLTCSENKVFQFSLSLQKVLKLSKDGREQLIHGKRLKAAVNSQRPSSINMGESSPELAENIETYIAGYKARSLSDASSPYKPSSSSSDNSSSSLVASSSLASSSSSVASSPNNSPIPRRTSFVISDTSTMYEKDERKKKKLINSHKLTKAVSVAHIDPKKLALAAKKAHKKLEEEKKSKDKKEKKPK